MSHTKYTLYVPDSLQPFEYELRDRLATLQLIAGGSTQTQVVGGWIGERGTVVEPVTTYSYLIPSGESARIGVFETAIENVAHTLKSLGEESVLVEITTATARFI